MKRSSSPTAGGRGRKQPPGRSSQFDSFPALRTALEQRLAQHRHDHLVYSALLLLLTPVGLAIVALVICLIEPDIPYYLASSGPTADPMTAVGYGAAMLLFLVVAGFTIVAGVSLAQRWSQVTLYRRVSVAGALLLISALAALTYHTDWIATHAILFWIIYWVAAVGSMVLLGYGYGKPPRGTHDHSSFIGALLHTYGEVLEGSSLWRAPIPSVVTVAAALLDQAAGLRLPDTPELRSKRLSSDARELLEDLEFIRPSPEPLKICWKGEDFLGIDRLGVPQR